jgi:serine/threonine protein kinase
MDKRLTDLLRELELECDDEQLNSQMAPWRLRILLSGDDPVMALTFVGYEPLTILNSRGPRPLPGQSAPPCQEVVIKFPAPSHRHEGHRVRLKDNLEALQYEAAWLRRVKEHKISNIVSLLDDKTQHDLPFLVMERLGDSLLDVLKHQGPITVKDCLTMVHDVATALDGLHNHTFFHNDIKPGNILKGTDRWTLIDPAPEDRVTYLYSHRSYPKGPQRDIVALGRTFLAAYLGREGEKTLPPECPELQAYPGAEELLQQMLGEGEKDPPTAHRIRCQAARLLLQ